MRTLAKKLLNSIPSRVSRYVIDFYDSFSSGTTTSPRASDVGELLITDADGIMSISGGNLVVNGTTTGTGNGIIVGDGAGSAKLFTRVDGLCLYTTQNTIAIASNTRAISFSATDLSSAVLTYGFLYVNTIRYTIMDGGQVVINNDISAGELAVFVIMRSTGGYLITKHPAGTDFKVRWVYDNSSANLYAKAQIHNIGTYNLTYSQLKVAQLGSPFVGDALQIFNISGTLSPFYDQDTQSGNFITRVTVGALPASGSHQIRFRIQDTENYWLFQVTVGGRAQLIRFVSNASSGELMALTGVIAGDVITIIADGTDITYVKKSGSTYTSISYASATQFQDKTKTRTQLIGTGGSLQDWVCYPRYIIGAGKNMLDQVALEN